MANSSSNSNGIKTPNIGGALKNPRYVVCHYTASTNLRNTVSWLCDKRARASAHIVLGRDGELEALVPFSRVAWHAGVSSWKSYNGLNNCSIGIELINAGPVRAVDDGFRSVVGNQIIEDVVEAKHKHPSVAYRFWQVYPEAQVEALDTLLGQLFNDFPTLVEVVGHDDVSPGRKFDPGPAFEEHMVRLKAKYDKY